MKFWKILIGLKLTSFLIIKTTISKSLIYKNFCTGDNPVLLIKKQIPVIFIIRLQDS